MLESAGGFLSDWIRRPDSSAARSINIERDNEDTFLLDKYMLGPAGAQVLSRFAAALHGEKVTAWSLTGPYGMGKSALVNFLVALIGPAHSERTNTAVRRLRAARPALADSLRGGVDQLSGQAGLFPIAVTAGYEPLSTTLLRGLAKATASWAGVAGPDALSALTDDEPAEFGERIVVDVMPKNRDLAERAEALSVDVAREFRDVHEELIEMLNLNLQALSEVAAAIDAGDFSRITSANKLLSDARAAERRYVQRLEDLAAEYGVKFEK